ncbi:MAG TPA: GntR family transcriptional regulator [Jiangellaceae bacterium]
MDRLDPDDVRPPYQQVAGKLRDAIRGGEYGPGAKLPGHQAVADEYGVSVGTVKRAFTLLQQEKLVVTRQGQGSYVRPDAAAVDGQDDDNLGDLRLGLERLAARVEAIERRLDTANEGQ